MWWVHGRPTVEMREFAMKKKVKLNLEILELETKLAPAMPTLFCTCGSAAPLGEDGSTQTGAEC